MIEVMDKSIDILRYVLQVDKNINHVGLGEYVEIAKRNNPTVSYAELAQLVGSERDRLNYAHLSLGLPEDVKQLTRVHNIKQRVVRKMVIMQESGCPEDVLLSYAKTVVDCGIKTVEAEKLGEKLRDVYRSEYNLSKKEVLSAQLLSSARVESEFKGALQANSKRILEVDSKEAHTGIYGVGIRDNGEFKRYEEWCEESGSYKETPAFSSWSKMIKRCYSPNESDTSPCYRDCTVDKQWFSFQNFAKWYNANYYTLEGERMCIDKDSLVQGNTLYSPDTCLIIPHSLNAIVPTRKSATRDLALGVTKVGEKYTATLSCAMLEVKEGRIVLIPAAERTKERKKTLRLGTYDTEAEAFLAYRTVREDYTKEVAYLYMTLEGLTAEAHRNLKKVYDALYIQEILPYDYGAMRGKSCEDVLGELYINIEGVKYRNIREAVAAHRLDYNTFKLRIFSGNHTIEEAITGVIGEKNKSWIEKADHLGQEFKTQTAMYAHWGVAPETFRTRRLKGYTLEEALTGNIHKDHLGYGYKSINAMCAYWNVSEGTYRKRIKQGRTLEQALTGV